MPSLVQGRIVYALDAICDPQGGNPKANRPFIVISDNEYIKNNDCVVGVAVSHNTWTGEDVAVNLPWSAGSPPACTRFRDPCVAVCSWQVCLAKSRIQISDGHVRGAHLLEILQKL